MARFRWPGYKNGIEWVPPKVLPQGWTPPPMGLGPAVDSERMLEKQRFYEPVSENIMTEIQIMVKKIQALEHERIEMALEQALQSGTKGVLVIRDRYGFFAHAQASSVVPYGMILDATNKTLTKWEVTSNAGTVPPPGEGRGGAG